MRGQHSTFALTVNIDPDSDIERDKILDVDKPYRAQLDGDESEHLR